jgi:polyhydroxybutyrate depolymerase
MRPMKRAAVFLMALTLAMASVAHAQKASNLIIETADGPRHALVLPQGKGPHPTVIVLHGALGTGAGMAATTGFAEAAARHGFTAVFPDGLGRRWHDGRAGGPKGPNDIAFIHTLVALLIAERIADPHHIYLAGVSNGGMMSFTLACKEADLFAGIGTVIANMPAGIEPCRPKPMRVVMVNGTADPMVPYRGGTVGLLGGRGEVWSVDKTVALFAHVNRCGSSKIKALPAHDLADRTQVTRIDWSNCQPGTSVTLYRVEGGGHALPGRRSLAHHLLGRVNPDFVAAEAIMAAFSFNPKP